MTAQLSSTPVQKFFDNNGNPLFNGKLFSYAAGTSTPQATYTDSTMGTPNTNPIILNSRGEANVWLDPMLTYKFILQDSSGNQIWAVDNIPGSGNFGSVSNIATLRTITGVGIANNQTIILDGYYSSGDGGGGPFFWNSSSTATDDGGTIIQPTGIPTGRWIRIYDGLRASVKWFGAKGDGVTDDTTSIQNTITLFSTTGGIVVVPYGTYIISSPLTIGNGSSGSNATTGYNLFLEGAGCGGSYLSSVGTTFKWNASGGTMVRWFGAVSGGGMTGIGLDGNGQAATGLFVDHLIGGRFPHIAVKNCTGNGIFISTRTIASSLGGCANNNFGIVEIEIPANGTGLLIDGDTSNVSSDDVLNCNFDIVNIVMNGAGNNGLILGYCDFIKIGVLNITALNALTGGTVGLVFKGHGPAGSTAWPALNHLCRVASAGGISSQTGSGTPILNKIDQYDTADSGGAIPSATGVYGFATLTVGGVDVLVPFGIGASPTNIATADNFQITGTGATTVLSGPGLQGLYEICVSLRVITASTTVTASVSSSDETTNNTFTLYATKSGATTQTALSAALLTTGAWACLPIYARFATGGANTPTLTITCGTANQVFVTAVMRKIE